MSLEIMVEHKLCSLVAELFVNTDLCLSQKFHFPCQIWVLSYFLYSQEALTICNNIK